MSSQPNNLESANNDIEFESASTLLPPIYKSSIHNEVLDLHHPPPRRSSVSTSESVLPFPKVYVSTYTTPAHPHITSEGKETYKQKTATGPSVRTRSGITKQPSDSIIASRGCAAVAADGRLATGRSGLRLGVGVVEPRPGGERRGAVGARRSTGGSGGSGGRRRWWFSINGQSRGGP